MKWDDKDIERFMTFVDILPNGCWFWCGARSRGKGNKKWYGSFNVKGKVVRAHRFACEAIGKMPPLQQGDHRDHTCHFSLCVNPRHFEYVSAAVNQGRKCSELARNDHMQCGARHWRANRHGWPEMEGGGAQPKHLRSGRVAHLKPPPAP